MLFTEVLLDAERNMGSGKEAQRNEVQGPVFWSEVDLGEEPIPVPEPALDLDCSRSSGFTVVNATDFFRNDACSNVETEEVGWTSSSRRLRSRSGSVWRRLRNRLWQSEDGELQFRGGEPAEPLAERTATPGSAKQSQNSAHHSRWHVLRTFKSSGELLDWEEYQGKLAQEWEQDIIPNWEKRLKSKRIRSLIFEGIPSNVRGQAWPRLIGNAMQIAPGLFDVLCEQAKRTRRALHHQDATIGQADGDLGGAGGEAETLLTHQKERMDGGICPAAQKAIVLDLPRTFPQLGFFHAEGSPFQSELRRLLEAYAHFRPEFGYSQGMSYLAAALLLYLDAPTAFCCFANILSKSRCLSSFYKMQNPEVQAYLLLQQRLVFSENPVLAAHFDAIGIESDMYIISWIMSLYCRVLPLDDALRIWDAFFLLGDAFLFKAALAILRVLQDSLLRGNFEDCAYTLSHLPETVTATSIFAEVRQVRFSRKRFAEIFKECLVVAAQNSAKTPSKQRTPSRIRHQNDPDDGAGECATPRLPDAAPR